MRLVIDIPEPIYEELIWRDYRMTREEIKNTPEIVDFMLDKSVIEDSRMKLHKRLEEICELANQALEQDPFMNKPCVAHQVCHEDKVKVLDKIRAEIEEYKSNQLIWAIGVENLEKGKRIALEYVLAILDKYKAESEDKE